MAALSALTTRAPAQVPTHIKVEIDYMDDQAGHSHRPSQAALDMAVQMFACRGITLELVVDQSVPHITMLACTTPPVWPETIFTCSGTSSYSAYRDIFFQGGAGWHYCLFIHQYDDGLTTLSSGAAEQSGNELLVAAGIFENGEASPWEEAATFVHELGHNLGLDHYSPSTGTLTLGPYAPNLASVMSYQYQLRGIKSQMECLGLVGKDHLFKELDYSSGRLPPLPELDLNETLGVGIHPVDWNCSGTIEGGSMSADIDGGADPEWCSSTLGFGVVHDSDEWSRVVDSADDPAVVNDWTPQPVAVCATLAELVSDLDNPNDCYPAYPWPTPPAANEACTVGEMIWVDPANLGSQVGNGEFPYAWVDWGVLFAPEGSILYLQPGTHRSSNGNPILIDRPLILAGPGGAVVDP
jgi:hypothetical protein